MTIIKKSTIINQTDVMEIQELSRKCQLIQDSFDYHDKKAILQFFKNKQPFKMEQYVIVLNGLI